MSTFNHVITPFPGIKFSVGFYGSNMPRCCGIWEIQVVLKAFPTEEKDLQFVFANLKNVYPELVKSFLSTCLNGTSTATKCAQGQDYYADPIGPTMFIMTDVVRSRALWSHEEWQHWAENLDNKEVTPGFTRVNWLSQYLQEYCRVFYLSEYLKQHPEYGTITQAPVFRANSNYLRLEGKVKIDTTIKGGREQIEHRHILTSFIWVPSQDLVKQEKRVPEYTSMEEVFSVYDDKGKYIPRAKEIKPEVIAPPPVVVPVPEPAYVSQPTRGVGVVPPPVMPPPAVRRAPRSRVPATPLQHQLDQAAARRATALARQAQRDVIAHQRDMQRLNTIDGINVGEDAPAWRRINIRS